MQAPCTLMILLIAYIHKSIKQNEWPLCLAYDDRIHHAVVALHCFERADVKAYF